MLDYDAGDFYNDAACLPFAEQLLPDRCTHHYNQMNHKLNSVQASECKETPSQKYLARSYCWR